MILTHEPPLPKPMNNRILPTITKAPPSPRKRYHTLLITLSIILWPVVTIYVFHRRPPPPPPLPSKPLPVIEPKPYLLTKKIRSIAYHFQHYGPTKPRAAFLLTAPPIHPSTRMTIDTLEKTIEAMQNTIRSVLETTDLNRILVFVCVFSPRDLPSVIPPDRAAPELQKRFEKLDGTGSKHFHGSKGHSHGTESDHEHAPKVRVVLSDEPGVAGRRVDGARFVHILSEAHTRAGLKSPDEDLLLVLMGHGATIEPGVKNTGGEWIQRATAALEPPEIKPYKLRALSFALEGKQYFGETTGFGLDFRRIGMQASSEALSESNGVSWPSPVLGGGVTVLRVETFWDLVVKREDEEAKERIKNAPKDGPEYRAWRATQTEFGADLELSLLLWNCGDGIRVLPSLKAISPKHNHTQYQENEKGGYFLTERDSVRLAATWTRASTNKQLELKLNVFRKLKERYRLTRVDIMIAVDQIMKEPNFPGRFKGCHPFEWFMDTINRYEDTVHDDVQDIVKEDDDEYEEVVREVVNGVPNVPDELVYRADGSVIHPGEPIVIHPKVNNTIPYRKPWLRPLNLKIVQRTSPVDLTFIDITDISTSTDHYLGAVDEQNRTGYVHNATALRQSPPAFDRTGLEKGCKNHDDNWKMLTNRVAVDLEGHKKKEEEAQSSSGQRRRVKIFCTVYTIEKNHGRLSAIRETWGPKCDGFMVASDKTDRDLGTVNIKHEGQEEYHNIWQKVRSIWKYVYQNYYQEYDWFHIGGDDLYVLVENLRLYLESDEIVLAANGGVDMPKEGEEPTEAYPLFLGRRFKEQGNEERIFNSGGSGYTLNRAALKALVVNAFPTCMPHLRTFAEDVMVAQCFRNKVHVYPYDTKDEQNSERYMPFVPAHHLTYKIPMNVENDWYAEYSINIRQGYYHCSKRSVAFHYIKPPLMRRMHSILYGFCEEKE